MNQYILIMDISFDLNFELMQGVVSLQSHTTKTCACNNLPHSGVMAHLECVATKIMVKK